jgi:hypothetical protein
MSVSPDLHWPRGYEAGLAHLPSGCSNETMRDNKRVILTAAHEQLATTRHGPDAFLLELTNPDEFTAPSGELPPYFADEFRQNDSRRAAVADYYPFTYQPGATNFWVDFADLSLGGGVFGNGFLQEEHLCCEIPELANAAGLRFASGFTFLVTRKPQSSKPGEGFPFPLVLRNAWRTMNLPSGLDITQKGYPDGEIIGWAIKQPHQLNVLAMAAPKLANHDLSTQKDKTVVNDLVNTFVAAFTLARDAAEPRRALVNTGPIGAGNFNNNAYLVYVLQVLAARLVGVDIVLFMYDSPRKDKAEELLNDLEGLLPRTAVKVSDVLALVRTLLFPPWPPPRSG